MQETDNPIRNYDICAHPYDRNKKNKAIVIQNHPLAGLGLLKDVLINKGFTIKTYDGQKDDLSEIDHLSADLLIVLGGTASAYERDKHPWLKQIEKLLKKYIDADVPLLGSCLGGQLIAQILGATVYKSDEQKEFGYFLLKLTDAGTKHPISYFAESGIHVPESHGDVFELPENVVLLASTERCSNQIFKKGNTLAFQFHPEVTAATFQDWIQMWAKLAESTGAYFDKTTPHKQMQTYAAAFEKAAKMFFHKWIDEVIYNKMYLIS